MLNLFHTAGEGCGALFFPVDFGVVLIEIRTLKMMALLFIIESLCNIIKYLHHQHDIVKYRFPKYQFRKEYSQIFREPKNTV